MKLWIARDEDNSLFLYDEKPIKRKHRFTLKWFSHAFKIKSQYFSSVTFENSPQEVELKLCHQIETIKIADCNPKAQPCVLTNHGIDTNVVKFD